MTQENVVWHRPLIEREQRDPKGFYARALKGEINYYTGVSAAYEEPLEPELVLGTATLSVERCAATVLEMLRKHGVIAPAASAAALKISHENTHKHTE
ncbi:MAG: adenylyl-sulfate kinase [Betaproteobacteria bacterium]|nr:adenylyl-sulfate kinase [Betaproteobacteria bacterium]